MAGIRGRFWVGPERKIKHRRAWAYACGTIRAARRRGPSRLGIRHAAAAGPAIPVRVLRQILPVAVRPKAENAAEFPRLVRCQTSTGRFSVDRNGAPLVDQPLPHPSPQAPELPGSSPDLVTQLHAVGANPRTVLIAWNQEVPSFWPFK